MLYLEKMEAMKITAARVLHLKKRAVQMFK